MLGVPFGVQKTTYVLINIMALRSLEQLFDTVVGDTYQEKLNTLSLCNCCERHKVNRPMYFSHWLDLPRSNRFDYSCECNCRHISRWICRQCPYEPESEDVVH